MKCSCRLTFQGCILIQIPLVQKEKLLLELMSENICSYTANSFCHRVEVCRKMRKCQLPAFSPFRTKILKLDFYCDKGLTPDHTIPTFNSLEKGGF